jgi:hypothetical protein
LEAREVAPRRVTAQIAASIVAAVVVLSATSYASAQDDAVVQMKDDPSRRLVLENAAVRVWEVNVPIGAAGPYHEHKIDMMSVRINSTEVTNDPKGGLFSFKTNMRLEAGTVGYSDYSGKPYVHRIVPVGPNPHRVIEFEFLASPAADRVVPAEREGVKQLLDNRRARAFRLLLEPGQSSDVATLGNSLLVVVKGSGSLKPGTVQWHAEPSQRSIKNDGASVMEVVEVAVK